MAAVAWTDVAGFFPSLADVGEDQQDDILAWVNTALDVSLFGGEDGPKLRLARIYLAAHHGELALPGSELGDVASETIGGDSISVSYAASSGGDSLAQTVGGDLYLQLVKTSAARLGFVTGVC